MRSTKLQKLQATNVFLNKISNKNENYAVFRNGRHQIHGPNSVKS